MNTFDPCAFWKENDSCLAASGTDKSRVALSFWLDDHYLLEAMNLPSTIRYYEDFEYRLGLHRTINDGIEKVIGKRFYSEDPVEAPVPVRFEVLMGSYWKTIEGGTPWLESNVEDIEDVKRLIGLAQKLDMKKAAFPEDWNAKKTAWERAMGKPFRTGGTFSRGPATMATSILGTTNTCIFIMTDPDVMEEFFRVMADNLIEYNLALMEDTGVGSGEGFQFNDDNCYLFPPAQYEAMCAPFLERVFAKFAPLPSHLRYQHSDSAMGHLMGILNDLGLNRVNFGPTIHPSEIRKAMPKAVIYGQVPPFTIRNGSEAEIVEAVRRDIDSVGADGNLVECPAGSVAGGTPFENLLVYMKAVDTWGRIYG